MAPIKVFITGVTGYIGSTAIDFLLNKETTASRFSFRALVRSKEKAEKDIRPLGIVPVIGDLDSLALLEAEAANADVVLSFADADHLPSIKAILKGLSHRPRAENGRRRPIFIHTSGTGILLDGAGGKFASSDIYYDNDVAQLAAIPPTQYHRDIDLELLDPGLKGLVDTYIVAPPTIWGLGTGAGNHNSMQIPLMVSTALKHQQAFQIGEGKNVWSKVHVIDLARLYYLLLERALQEPEDHFVINPDRVPLPKNENAYYFVQSGDDYTFGSVAQEIAKVFADIGINDSEAVKSVTEEEESAYWPPYARIALGGNSRSRAVKAREILGWEPKYDDFNGHIHEEIQRQLKLQGEKKEN